MNRIEQYIDTDRREQNKNWIEQNTIENTKMEK